MSILKKYKSTSKAYWYKLRSRFVFTDGQAT